MSSDLVVPRLALPIKISLENLPRLKQSLWTDLLWKEFQHELMFCRQGIYNLGEILTDSLMGLAHVFPLEGKE